VLGAPEVLRAHLYGESNYAVLDATVDAWASAGQRVLLFARSPTLPPRDAAGQPTPPADLVPLGVLSLSDDLRPEAKETLAGFAAAGIQLKVISGDHPQTVATLARQAGLDVGRDVGRDGEARVVSGAELADLDDVGLSEVAREGAIFGRVTPEQKRRLVRALRGQGHYVAMIGDGVNDVLSLKEANLAIAMQSGSQAARGVADIVLLRDSFACLPHAFGEGQRIRNGMDAILKLFLTRVLYVTLLVAATGITGGFPFAPRQSAILVFLTVGVPTLALAAWARPGQGNPHTLDALLHFVVPAASTLCLGAFGVYLAVFVPRYDALRATLGPQEALRAAQPAAQTALTTFAVFGGLLLVLFVAPPSRFWTGGSSLNGDRRPLVLTLGLFAAYGLILAVPPLRAAFELAPLSLEANLLLLGAALAWALGLRYIWRARLLQRFLGLDAWQDA
jgi:cation-transporting ATPase E